MPLNKKVLESKEGMGVFCIERKQATKPQEFHFATNERIPLPTATVVDLFDKLSVNSESYHVNKIPRNTRPNPFHLQTKVYWRLNQSTAQLPPLVSILIRLCSQSFVFRSRLLHLLHRNPRVSVDSKPFVLIFVKNPV